LITGARDDLRVQGKSKSQRELMDVEAVAGHLLKPGSLFAFLASDRRKLFADALFEDMFPSGRGRPSVPADVMAAVITLQALHNLSDSETVDAVTYDLRWKAARGLPVTAAAFHATTLTYWRRRLAASEHPNRIFDAVKAVVAETGVLTGKTRRTLDSTVLDDAGKPAIAWDDEQARAELVDALVGDAHRLLGHLPERELGPKAADAVALLALIAGQDVEPVDDSDGTDGRWRIAQRVAPDRVISVVDPDARHAHETVSRRQDGFKAHVAVEPDTGIITDCALTKASGAEHSDAAVGPSLLDTETEQVEVLADSAYGSGDARAELAAAGHDTVIKPMPLRPAVEGGFTLDDFTVDEAAGTVTCPNGLIRRITAKRTVTFGAGCRGCPLRARCTTSRRGRKLALHKHEDLLRAAHRHAETPEFQEIYRQHRPMAERSISWLTRGNRRVRYRGVAKNDHWLHHRAAGLNLRRLLNLGLTCDTNGWVMA
jgi:transposase